MIESSKNAAIKIIEEWQADGSTNFSPEKVQEKILWMSVHLRKQIKFVETSFNERRINFLLICI